MRRTSTFPGHAGGAAALLALVACACGERRLGEPLSGLSSEEHQLFELGQLVFGREFRPSSGLGPLFNAVSCAACHADPTLGGNGAASVVHARGIDEEGACDALLEQGGPVLQQRATPALTAALGIEFEPLPRAASSRAQYTTPDLFGLGLLDAVPQEVLLALADPEDEDGDGISGRTNRFEDGRIGRFGRKAFWPTLAECIEFSFSSELGLTTAGFPRENDLAGTPLPEGIDPLAEPELAAEELAQADAFVRLLAPPPRGEPAPDGRGEVSEGELIFRAIGCAECHVPVLRTGDNPIRALAQREVHGYTDLLLHDMGPELADACLGQASPSEFRTEPLMGLRHARVFLHDGRAATIEDAIRAHGGEACLARNKFQELGPEKRGALLAFLGTL